jgi:outer membrane protein TolC
LDLQRAGIHLAEAWQRLAVVQKSVESAREALRITRVRYKEGATDITELLTAQVGLTASQTREVVAYYDYLIALSNVKRAGGELVAEYVNQN